MAYQMVAVESYRPAKTSGLHGPIHIRPVEGQGYSTDMHVECSKTLSRNYPVGTKFRIMAKVTNRQGGTPFLYSSWRWHVEVIA